MVRDKNRDRIPRVRRDLSVKKCVNSAEFGFPGRKMEPAPFVVLSQVFQVTLETEKIIFQK